MNNIRSEYIGAVLALGSLGLFTYYFNKNALNVEIDEGPFGEVKSSIRLVHQHPDGILN